MGQDGSGGGADEEQGDEEAIGSNPQLPAIWSHQTCSPVLSCIPPDCDQVGDVGDEKNGPRNNPALHCQHQRSGVPKVVKDVKENDEVEDDGVENHEEGGSIHQTHH